MSLSEPDPLSSIQLTVMLLSFVYCVAGGRRWQCLARKLDEKKQHDSTARILPDDPANNFLGYRISTLGWGATLAGRPRCHKKYATADIHSRRVLLVVVSQVSWRFLFV